MKYITAVFGLLLSSAAFAASWTQQFAYTPVDPNGGATVLHEYQYRLNGGAWSSTLTSATIPLLADILIENDMVVEIRGRPCGADNYCPAPWLVAPYTVPADMQPYSQAVITIGPAGWQTP